MPAAPAIAPLLGTIAVKTTSVPVAPSVGDAFGQVLRTVWGAASGPVAVPAPTDGAFGSAAQADPDPEAATIDEAADQAPAPLTDRPVAAPTAALVGKPEHPAKDESAAAVARASATPDADPKAVTFGPFVMPAPLPGNSHQAIPAQDAAPAQAAAAGQGIPSQRTSPARAVAAAKGLDIGEAPPPGAGPTQTAVPLQAGVFARAGVPAQAAVPANGLDVGGLERFQADWNRTQGSPSSSWPGVSGPPIAARAGTGGPDKPGHDGKGRLHVSSQAENALTPPSVVLSRTAASATEPDLKGRPPQAALSAAAASAPEVEAIAQTVPIPTSAHPSAGAAAAEPVHAVPDPSASPASDSLAGRGGVGSDGNAPSPQPPESPDSGGQPAPTTVAPGTPSQPERAASGSPGQPAAPASALPTASIASPPLSPPGTDHKITLRPVDAAADPARSVAPSGTPLEQVVPTGTPPAVPTPSSVTVTSQPHPASPAEQVAPALLTLAKTTDGGQQMTVRLQPADLGMVQVRIAQAASGTTQIDITAENPATLLALQRDQPQLHRSLDEAGIPAAGRTVTFHVAQAAASSGPNAGHAGNHQGSASRNSTGGAGADGSAAGGRGSYKARERNTYPTGRRPADLPATAGPRAATAAQSYRIGLDITA